MLEKKIKNVKRIQGCKLVRVNYASEKKWSAQVILMQGHTAEIICLGASAFKTIKEIALDWSLVLCS